MGIFYYILLPFTWLLNFFYDISGNYGVALICFALVIKLILFPLTLKGKRGMIQMNMLSSKMQQLQKQFGKDKERYNMEVQKLYEREHVNPMSGCLWSFLPIFVLLPLFNIIREPLHYLMALTPEQISTVASTVDWSTQALANNWIKQAADTFQNVGYNQMYLASLINDQTLPAVQAALGEGTKVFAMNFNFLGLDLAMLPTWKIWEDFRWPVIGALLLILISAGSGLLMSKISMKTNQMNNQSQNGQMETTNKVMMWVMPLMSLWIGFVMPVGMCVYWVANNLLSMVQELVAGKMLKKDYEAARRAAEERARQEKEDEKKRKEEARLERARRAEEAKKHKKAVKKDEPAEPGINKDDSKIGMRAYARGRSYDPARFGAVQAYVDPDEIIRQELAAAEAGKKSKKSKKSKEGDKEENKK